MDLDTIEVCWNILEQYVKKTDQQHAVSHLVAELMDSGFPDEDIKQLANISELFANESTNTILAKMKNIGTMKNDLV